MGRVRKQVFSDAVKSAFTEGMYFGHDQRHRRVKHSPGMLYRLSNDPNYQSYLDQMQSWLDSQGVGKVRPVGMGAERAVFEDGDRVVKVGLEHRAVGSNHYKPPTGVWGVTPWLGNTDAGPFRMEIQPKVDLVDRGQTGKGRRKPVGSDIRALQDALARQGWYWQDNHIGNIGFVPGTDYMPTVIDGPVYPSSLSSFPGEKQPGTVPRLFLPPTRPAWATALMAGTSGAASQASAAPTVQAGSEETLTDYLRRMQPPVSADPPPDDGKPQPNPFAAAPDHPPLFSGTSPLTEYQTDFPEMDQYRQLASNAFRSAPVIRHEDTILTPAEYIESLLGSSAVPLVEPYLTGVKLPDDSGPSNVAISVLKKLKAQSLGGDEQVFPGQTLQQREDRRTSPLQEGRFMTSEGLDEALAATRVYNLLSATHVNPSVAPDTASSLSAALSGLGAAFAYPMAAFTGGLQGEDEFLGKGTIDMANRRIGTALVNPLQARIQEALYQDQQAQEGERRGQYKSGLTGGFYPQTQVTSGQGMADQLQYDNANLNTFLSSTVLPQAFSGTPIVGTADAPLLRNLIANLMRNVPVMPEGLSAEEAEEMRGELRDYLDAQEQQYVAEYPAYQRRWNERAIGEMFPVEEYSFPSPANNALATSWKYWLDPMTLATLGGGALLGTAKGGGNALVRALANAAKDYAIDTATIESPFTLGVSAAAGANPADLVAPMPSSLVTDEEGNPVPANDPRYEFYLGRHQDEQKNRLGRLLEFGKKWFPYPPPQMPSGEGAEYTERLSYQ